MLDLVIRGGTVVAPVGVGNWDVAIEGERIVALAAPGTLTQDVGRVIDASGKLVVPGGIDPHVHCKWPIPHPPGLSADPSQVSRAAIYGGTTTLIDFAAWVPGETLQQTIENREPDWKGNCYADYAYHVMLRGVLPWEIFDQIPETIAAGFPSFKIFMTNIWPHVTGRMVKLGHIWEVLQRTSRHGGIVAIHAEDDDIV
ncbi:MAG: dihydropyrimidinase, partial [Chloroflexi bacterium]|nr:dihydropyrimidinase [Chloroflexota bacterium]